MGYFRYTEWFRELKSILICTYQKNTNNIQKDSKILWCISSQSNKHPTCK